MPERIQPDKVRRSADSNPRGVLIGHNKRISIEFCCRNWTRNRDCSDHNTAYGNPIRTR